MTKWTALDGSFRWEHLLHQHVTLAARYVKLEAAPDLAIAPDGEPYLFRWHLIPRNDDANVYFHIQVASDPERPLHDHPYDNQSVILAGGYIEHIGGTSIEYTMKRFPGDVIGRKATDLHRLELPRGIPYSMSQFSTGPRIREWGFLVPDRKLGHKWVSHEDYVDTRDGLSVLTKELPK